MSNHGSQNKQQGKWDREDWLPPLCAVLVAGGVAAGAVVGNSNLVAATNALNEALQSGAAVLWVENEKIDINNPKTLERVLTYFAKRGEDAAAIDLKNSEGKIVIACRANGNELKDIITGKMLKTQDIRVLEINTEALASLCNIKEDQIKPLTSVTKPRASAGEYSITTDGAVAMGTVEGKINSVSYI